MKDSDKPAWWIFRGDADSHDQIERLPPPPPWREFDDEAREQHNRTFQPDEKDIKLVNAALYLRRPLLITGKPGVGKTSLAYAVARELKLGKVLRWSITTQSTLQDGLYRYDAIARLQDASLDKKKGLISDYMRLGPLGTAFAAKERPRLLLIDEIDKSDIDLPNDLLHIFEEGAFEIPELRRLRKTQAEFHVLGHDDNDDADEAAGIPVQGGWVRCTQFPLVMMTSNGEREFPPAFLRRCLQLEMTLPDTEKLLHIVRAHLKVQPGSQRETEVKELITTFWQRGQKKDLATDQLLNAVHLALKDIDLEKRYEDPQALINALWHELSPGR